MAEPRKGWKQALDGLVEDLRQASGPRLAGVLLYGSRARGEAAPDSDVDVLVLLTPPLDFWAEFDRITALAARWSLQYDVVRREGRRVA